MKPANILIHNGIFKIADLGFSKELPEEGEMAQHTVLGTRSTMAPEVIHKEAYSFKVSINLFRLTSGHLESSFS